MKLFEKAWRRLVKPRRFREPAMADWRRDRGEARRYRFANLSADSVVVDLGGFRGDWTQRMFDQFGCFFHVFEPHPRFAGELTRQFAEVPRIKVHPVALASQDGWFELSDLGDASSAFRRGDATVRCRSVEAASYLDKQGIEPIDAIKINIEGGEFDLLPHLVASGVIGSIGTLQVQFHRLSEDSPAQRDAIRVQLQATHRETWCYPFVWEEWVRR
jgi:FkbM family methyltransferase